MRTLLVASVACFMAAGFVTVATPITHGATAVNSASSGQATPLAIVGATVIDGATAPPLTDATVVVSGGRIATVGPRHEIDVPDGATVIDGAGRFLIPGLWDAHAHLSYWGEDALARLVAAGVTSIRELGGDPDEIAGWRDAIRAGERVGPDIWWCGPFLEGPNPGAEYRWEVEGPEAAREAVRELASRGVDFLKVQPLIGRPEVEALVAEAREHDLSVVGHVPRGMSALEASAIGLRSVEHVSPYLGLAEGELEAVARTYVANGTWMSPALYSMATAIAGAGADPETDPRMAEARAAVLRLQRAGVGLLVGSNFAFREWTQQPGSGLHQEMRALTAAGLEPWIVLQAATAGAAEFLGVGEERGTITPGKVADLVLLRADPLIDIGALAEIDVVVLRGTLLDAATLARLASEGPAAPIPRPYVSLGNVGGE
ncbi:MAG: amidohydrolase family protein [Thermoanaerobaculia bacterium]|nr:amidohydrolase family protein [Thermoanaerobaculia bacterium]